jgi:serine/threonine-protein kinase RsbW
VTVEATPDSSTVHLELDSQPENVALVRAMLRGIGGPLRLDRELIDDLITAVSEACNNVVVHAYEGGRGPMAVNLEARDGVVEVVVRDRGAGFWEAASALDHVGVGVPLMTALADQAEFLSNATGGTDVRLRFDPAGRRADQWIPGALVPAESAPLSAPEISTAPGFTTDTPTARADGDVVGSISPVTLVDGVLGRLARVLATRAHFSLERFSDLYLLFDELGSQARSWASRKHVDFAMSAERRRLQLRIGPVDSDAERVLHGANQTARGLGQLADEVVVEPSAQSQMLRVVVRDRAA